MISLPISNVFDPYRKQGPSFINELAGNTIVGANSGLRQVMQMARQVSRMDSSVLLLGETGVGKELIAAAIHAASERRDNPFVRVNCGAIAESLIDSQLFGYEKGAFTGAVARKPGFFERAHTGTIFLDEIGELPMSAQVRLLRVLGYQEIERVGGTESIPVNVRVICATHRDLQAMAREGLFRLDLLFRINLFPILIPALRQRKEDIPALVAYFLESKCQKLKLRTLPRLAPGALEPLMAHSWPGNIRELENLIERAMILNQIPMGDGMLRFDGLLAESVFRPNDVGPQTTTTLLPLEEIMADHIQTALKRADGRVEGKNGAARLLGLHPSTLRGRMRKLGIPYGKKDRCHGHPNQRKDEKAPLFT